MVGPRGFATVAEPVGGGAVLVVLGDTGVAGIGLGVGGRGDVGTAGVAGVTVGGGGVVGGVGVGVGGGGVGVDGVDVGVGVGSAVDSVPPGRIAIAIATTAATSTTTTANANHASRDELTGGAVRSVTSRSSAGRATESTTCAARPLGAAITACWAEPR